MMLSVAPTVDYELIRGIATHPKIFSRISDDDTPLREEWSPMQHPALTYLLASDEEGPCGYWMLQPHASYLLEVHTVLLPRVWGPKAIDLARIAIQWVWANTKTQRMFTLVPEFNRVALKFAEASGFKVFGDQPGAYLKNGKLHSIVYLGLSKVNR